MILIRTIIALGMLMYFTASARKLENLSGKQKNDGPKYKRTILMGNIDESDKATKSLLNSDSIKWGIFDYNLYEKRKTVKAFSPRDTLIKLNNGSFKIILYIDHPIYICPAYPGSAGIPPADIFKRGANTRYTSMGMPLEPGDSIYINKIRTSFYGGIYMNQQEFTGTGVEKIWCIQQIIRNSKLYDHPSFKPGNISLSDSVKKMILNTIDIFKNRLTESSIKLIESHYIPMLSLDISEHIENSNMELNDKSLLLLINGIKETDKYYSEQDPVLSYSYFFPKIILKRHILLYRINHKEDKKTGFTFSQFKYLTKSMSNIPIKEKILADYLYDALNTIGLDGEVLNSVGFFLQHTKSNSSYHIVISNLANKIKSEFNSAKEAYNFSLPDTSGTITSLSKFNGKVVLIDFMFTGCHACADLTPWLTKFSKDFENTDEVKFISISISPDKSGPGGWRRGIGKYSSKDAIQLNASIDTLSYYNNFNHPVIIKYGIVGYPQLVLIDKSGKLITNNAPKPDSQEGISKLKALINKVSNAN